MTRFGTSRLLFALCLGGCAHPLPTDAGSNTARNSSPVRFLALGDSFTIGTGSTPRDAFPARLAARWEQSGRSVTLLNLGVNGYTTQNLIDRELPAVASFAPTFVTLAIGANDIVHGSDAVAYRAQVRRIFAALSAAGIPGAHIVVCPQPDWAQSPVAADFGAPAEIEARIVEFNGVLADESAHAGARYIDLFPLMRDQALAHEIADDGLHPSAAAYDAWADALARAHVIGD